MRPFLRAIVEVAGIAILFNYGLPRGEIPGVASGVGESVRLDDQLVAFS